MVSICEGAVDRKCGVKKGESKMKTEHEIQQNNIIGLLKLIEQNPDLKIVPMVDGELGGDEFAYWMGSWGKAEIDEVYHEDDRNYFRSTDEEELIEKQADFIFYEEYPNHKYLNEEESKTVESKAKFIVEGLGWDKVIVVKIELP